MEEGSGYRKLEALDRESETGILKEGRTRRLNLPEELERNKKRSGGVCLKYLKLGVLLRDQGSNKITISDEVESKKLGKGRLVYALEDQAGFTSSVYFDRGENFELPHERYELLVKEDFWQENFDENIGKPHRPLGPRQLFYLETVLPEAEKTFEWVLGKACDPELNPELAPQAQELRDSLQAAA